jgi:hypothetical protein
VTQVKLSGGPFHGIEVPRPEYRWGRLNIVDRDDEDVLHVYRPKRDGSFVYDGPTKVLFRLPAPGEPA